MRWLIIRRNQFVNLLVNLLPSIQLTQYLVKNILYV
jgi:hypothetical protein